MRYPLAEAQELADRILRDLGNTTRRAVVAGSILRKAKMVKDIEVVAKPQMGKGLFAEDEFPMIEPIRKVVREIGR